MSASTCPASVPALRPPTPRRRRWARWADLVAGVITELGLEQPTVVAASMGGYLTFELLRRHLDLLGPLVLVATRAKSDDVDTWEKRTGQQEALAGGEDLATLAKGMVEGLLSQASLERPELVEYVLALMQHNLPEGWIAALEAMKNRPDAMSALRGMPRPTLVVAGELDRVTPLAESTLISRLVDDGELVLIKDSSHLPEPREPDGVQRGAADVPRPGRRRCGRDEAAEAERRRTTPSRRGEPSPRLRQRRAAAVAAEQRGGARVVVAVGTRRRSPPAIVVGQRLAQLDAPLVEAVDAPQEALRRHLVLVERDELARARRGELRGEDRRGRACCPGTCGGAPAAGSTPDAATSSAVRPNASASAWASRLAVSRSWWSVPASRSSVGRAKPMRSHGTSVVPWWSSW